MVLADIGHAIFDRNRYVQSQTNQGTLHLIQILRCVALGVRQDPLENYFSRYTGSTDVHEACEYILQEFINTNHAQLILYAQ